MICCTRMPGDRRTATEAVRKRSGMYKPVTRMLFGDARDAVERVVTTLRTRG
jgi:hypothetical protein